MPRVRTPDEFRTAIDRAREQYKERLTNIVTQWRETQLGRTAPAQFDQIEAQYRDLEAHARHYLIDPLLESLNWEIDKNVSIEFPTVSIEGAKRRLDYAGQEGGSGEVLLAVEAKRFSEKLPGSPTSVKETRIERIGRALTQLKQEVIPDRDTLPAYFLEHISQIRDYVIDTKQDQSDWPGRAVLTNGEWLLLFEDPSDAFGGTETVDLEKIHLFENYGDIRFHAARIFSLLDRYSCSSRPFPTTIEHLSQHVDLANIDGVMYGLFVAVDPIRGFGRTRPTLNVEPILLVRASGIRASEFRWFQIPTGDDFSFPCGQEDPSSHIRHCKESMDRQRNQLESVLGQELPLIPIKEHYANEEFRDSLPGVTDFERKSFLIVTGDHPHFIRNSSTYSGCHFHSRNPATGQSHYISPDVTPYGPRENPLSFQCVESTRCCVSKRIDDLKSVYMDHDESRVAGAKSRLEAKTFCKIRPIERFLCCKTCVFQEVCESSMLLQMPCQKS